ncbi:MAG: AAA family ATPase, partial [Pseudomonadota bacterium]
MTQSMQQEDRGSQIIAIVGAKGGVGASTLALNSAFYLAKNLNEKVLLVDFDLNAQGDLSTMLDSEWKRIPDVISLMDKKVPASMLHGYLSNHESGVSFLSAFSEKQSETLQFLSPKQISSLFNYLSQAFDHIVVDCGAIFSTAHSPLFIGSSQILIVTHSLVHTLRHARIKYETLAQGYIPSEKIHFVVNEWIEDGKVPKDLVCGRLPKPTEYFLSQDLVGMDKSYEKALPLILHSSRSPFVKSLEEAFKKGMFSSTKRRFSLEEALQDDGLRILERWIHPLINTGQLPQKRVVENKVVKTKENIKQESDAPVDNDWMDLKKKILEELFKVMNLKQIGISSQKDAKSKLISQTTEA